MSDRNRVGRVKGLRAIGLAALAGAVVALAGGARADEPKGSGAANPPVVGKAARLPGALLHREGPEKQWHILKPGDAVHADDLIVGVPGGAILSHNGAVRLSLLSDLARLSPYPVLESAVRIHNNPDRDLDFTLDRGRVDVTSLRRGEPTHIRVRFHGDQVWDLTLEGRNTRVAFELYGRWPRGTRFHAPGKAAPEKEAAEEPTADLVLLVLHGDADVRAGGRRYAMTAPPGPAYFHWDSADGPDSGPRRLEELPGWARPTLAMIPRIRDLTALLDVLRSRLVEKGTIEEALLETLHADNPTARRIAVYGLGAVDDLAGLSDALSDPKHGDVRDTAVIALRHWIGRGPGQDLKLYQALVHDKKYSPHQAAMIVQLLHSFGDSDLAQPATYGALIDYLLSDQLAVRELAKWHLYRLVPAGKDIAYDPAGSPEERKQAYDKWKKLIPTGQLPPQPTAEKGAEPSEKK